MKFYDIATDEWTQKSIFFIAYYKFKKNYFNFRVWLAPKLIKWLGKGVLRIVLCDTIRKIGEEENTKDLAYLVFYSLEEYLGKRKR